FMGKRIINDLRASTGKGPINYLTELSVDDFTKNYLPELPEKIVGSEFLSKHKTHDDPVTTIQPDATYRVAGPASHPVQENERVLTFMEALKAANKGDEAARIKAGEQMYAAHESYRNNCELSTPEVDFLVEAVRKRGMKAGLYGAKITGGGTG